MFKPVSIFNPLPTIQNHLPKPLPSPLPNSSPLILKPKSNKFKVCNPNGQPTKYSEELKIKFCNFIKQGHSKTYACKAIGINFQTYVNWSGLNPKYPQYKIQDFVDAFSLAEKEKLENIEEDMLFRVIRAAKESKNWTAAAWILERMFPNKYSLKRNDYSLQNTNIIIDFRQKNEIAEIQIEDKNIENDTKQQKIIDTLEIEQKNE